MEIRYIALALTFASILGVCASFDLTIKTMLPFSLCLTIWSNEHCTSNVSFDLF